MSKDDPIRILYMEDDPGLARLFKKRLERAGYVVDLAHDGEQGLAIYAAGSYDIVAVDQVMPVCNGLDVIRTLAAQGPLPPTIMVTGTGSEEIAVEAMKLGASDYIVKDVDGGYLDLLPTVIERVLRQNRLAEERQQATVQLQQSEEHHKLLFEKLSDALFVETLDGEILDVNESACRLLGYTHEELTRMTVRDILPAGAQGFLPDEINDNTLNNRPLETVNIRKDGTLVPIELRGQVVRIAGQPRLLASLRDITARKQAENALLDSKQKIEALHGIACSLEACENEEDVYRLTVEATEKILDFSMCTLDIVEGNMLVVKATSVELPPDASRETVLEESGLAAKTHRTGRTTIFGSMEEVPEAKPTQEDFQSGISAPIGAFGVFQALSTEKNEFTDDDARLLELLLNYTTQAIERIRLMKELKEQATRDPLTTVYNRRYFNQVIEQEILRSKRYDHPIGFLMIDVNHFKKINDTYGHQVGDQVLQEVAKLLQEQVRESDVVVRYGGDEFLLLLIETNGETETVKQRILDEVAQRNATNPVFDFPVTLSIGSAHWSAEDGQTVEKILAEADKRMYEEKQSKGEWASG